MQRKKGKFSKDNFCTVLRISLNWGGIVKMWLGILVFTESSFRIDNSETKGSGDAIEGDDKYDWNVFQ